jgi:hypothetical protein
MEAKGVMITGNFTESDWADLQAILRMIERRHPEVTYRMVTCDPNLSMAEMTEVMRRTFPALPGQPPVEIGQENQDQLRMF